MTPSQVGPLLDQVAGPTASFTADGACDQDGLHDEAAARHPDAAVIVPPWSSAVPGATSSHCEASTHGLAEGLRLQLASPGRGRHRALQAGHRRWTTLAYRQTPRDRSGHRRPCPHQHAQARTTSVCPHPMNADQPAACCARKVGQATQSLSVRPGVSIATLSGDAAVPAAAHIVTASRPQNTQVSDRP